MKGYQEDTWQLNLTSRARKTWFQQRGKSSQHSSLLSLDQDDEVQKIVDLGAQWTVASTASAARHEAQSSALPQPGSDFSNRALSIVGDSMLGLTPPEVQSFAMQPNLAETLRSSSSRVLNKSGAANVILEGGGQSCSAMRMVAGIWDFTLMVELCADIRTDVGSTQIEV
ncbi:hypothetical protein LTR37_017207 [Vermiconidia calcicola]|uniref:Uncharacterized protein n=1 Tax=Vermiconidia calcicola TaxID=1690605 RepID=A0ACC3MLK1_9PEZI|nr:hypothetical protein LTR37_017207 [Vermiconidia calcicola]